MSTQEGGGLGKEVGELLPDPSYLTPQVWLDQQSWQRRLPWISC